MAAWVRRRDEARRLHVVPYQRGPQPPMTPALRRACAAAVHTVEPEGEVRRGGRAVLRVLALLGYRRLAALLGIPPLVWLVVLGYRLAARHRPLLARFFFRKETPYDGD